MFVTIFLFLTFDTVFSNDLLNTTSGIYIGRTVNYHNITVKQYLGIEYGRIKKRFERAEAIHRKNNSIINATSFGAICKPTMNSCVINNETTICSINYGIFSLKSSPSEQCLFLNVFIPIITNNQNKKAIFMWIHGGSSQIGTGNLFDGTILSALGNLIVITFNFRLNLFGFLSSGDERLEGNLGLYDQLMVLDWIYDNIDALGGDIQRITVGGHSAGAPHAYYLAKSPFNRGRIHRLILQSGCPYNIWSHIKANQALEKFHIVVNDNQCGMMKTFKEKLQCLQEKDYQSIGEYEHNAYTSANHTNVVIHGDYMKNFNEDNLDLNKTLGDIDILIGSNDDEGVHVAIIPILIEQIDQDSITLNNVNFTEISLKFLATMQPSKTCLHEKALELYHINHVPKNCFQSSNCYCSLFYNYSRLISDILFYNDYYRFLIQHIEYSNRTYIYQYSYQTSHKHLTLCDEYFSKHKLVGHFAELEYTWGIPLLFDKINHLNPLINYITYPKNLTDDYLDKQIQFSQEIIEQWINFINYGQPNSTKFQNQWISINNLSNGYFMHLKLNQSSIKKFQIPSNIQFWMKTCLIIENNEAFIYEISLIVFFFSIHLFVVYELNSIYFCSFFSYICVGQN